MDGELELDFDRFEYVQVQTLAGDSYHMKVGCLHAHPEPVRSSVTGEVVAMLCPDCDQQLPVMRP